MRRSARTIRFSIAILGVSAFALTATACTEADDTSLRQLSPGSTVFIDPWDQDNERGDEAQIEQLPGVKLATGKIRDGEWVIDTDQTFRTKQEGDYKVKIHLTENTVVNGKKIPAYWEVVELNGVKVGYDHDNCLPENGTYVVILDDKMQFESGSDKPAPVKEGQRATTGDCTPGGEPETKH